jgi:SAM-dependent methyltransferase
MKGEQQILPTPSRLLAHVHQKYAYLPRMHTLVERFSPYIEPGQRVLDVGCGSGMLGAALAKKIPGLVAEGVEIRPRGMEGIKVYGYEGSALPFPDDSYDVVILADVVHHERNPVALLKECNRVARRRVIIKDHLKHGWLSNLLISTLDWGANHPYGVECLYRYWTAEEWKQMLAGAGLVLKSFQTPLSIYHPVFDWLFGGRIHFIAVATKERDTRRMWNGIGFLRRFVPV